jgi:hypothetical protein
MKDCQQNEKGCVHVCVKGKSIEQIREREKRKEEKFENQSCLNVNLPIWNQAIPIAHICWFRMASEHAENTALTLLVSVAHVWWM